MRAATDVLVAPEPAIAILEQMKQSLCLGALCKEPKRTDNIRFGGESRRLAEWQDRRQRRRLLPFNASSHRERRD